MEVIPLDNTEMKKDEETKYFWLKIRVCMEVECELNKNFIHSSLMY